MAEVSAGLLVYRVIENKPEVLLVHPGGPFWRNKDAGAWSIPKGRVEQNEDLLDAAKREFEEETGCKPTGPFVALKPIKQKSGKTVHAWAMPGDFEATAMKSNLCTMEWPPRSGKRIEFPEVDRAEYFDLETAKKKINGAQAAFVVQLETMGIAAGECP